MLKSIEVRSRLNFNLATSSELSSNEFNF